MAIAGKVVELKIVIAAASNVSIVWSISPDINWTRDSGSGKNSRVLSIYKNVLQPGAVYKVSAFGE